LKTLALACSEELKSLLSITVLSGDSQLTTIYR